MPIGAPMLIHTVTADQGIPAFGPFCDLPSTLRMSVYRDRPEVAGRKSKWRDCEGCGMLAGCLAFTLNSRIRAPPTQRRWGHRGVQGARSRYPPRANVRLQCGKPRSGWYSLVLCAASRANDPANLTGRDAATPWDRGRSYAFDRGSFDTEW